MTRAALKDLILDMLIAMANAILAEHAEIPDELLAPGEISRAQLERLRKSQVARDERSAWIRSLEGSYRDRVAAATSDYEIKRAQIVWQLAKDAETESLAMPLGSRHIPADLRKWARAQLKQDESTAMRVYIYLLLRDVLDWEHAHLDEPEARSAMGRVQAEYVRKAQADTGRQVTFVDDDGNTVTLDNVSDSPSRASVDPRGWDRATSYARRAGAAKPKQERKFRTAYADSSGKHFVLTHRGWTYNQFMVSTSVAQRLYRRLDRGQLKLVG